MERKIGEIFNYNGEWYQCVESQDGSCKHCDMNFEGKCPIPIKECTESGRSDKSYVIFKKLGKVGEPYTHYCPSGRIIYFQRYKLFYKLYSHNTEYIMCDFNEDGIVSIEIKQKQEDMKEKNLNLKPFDLEAAKAGKPVCTRDGRKARIICFDAKDTQPIIGLYEEDIDGIAREYLCSYHMDGRMYDDQDCGYDLMMLPEKKEGWVNVYKGIDGITFSRHPYISKEEAIKEAGGALSGRIDTIKVYWKE